MKKSPFKSEHKARKVTCEKCGETFERIFYERIHKSVCSGPPKTFVPRSRSM
jgi:formylmethanofuran dehydrogenase subunit E